jgi:hypothetical protein
VAVVLLWKRLFLLFFLKAHNLRRTGASLVE